MKQEKVGLTTMNYILSIGGILLLSLVIILPPVFRIVFKEEIVKSEEKEEYLILTTTCSKENIVTNNTNENENYIFQHVNNKIKSYTKITQKTYLDPSTYEVDKQDFGRLVTAFSILNGYSYTVVPNDEDNHLTIKENYDLEIFTPTMIVIPNDTEPTAVSSEYSLNQSIDEIKIELSTNGYLCSQND